MNSDLHSDIKIIESWYKNAQPWTNAVRNGQIASRKLATDQAIVDAVVAAAPRSVLDIGCGEGWLARALEVKGISVIGIDAIPELIDVARRAGKSDYRLLSYEDIAAGKLDVSVDTAVCNFSLIGKESVEDIFRKVPALLNDRGQFIVQTLHPVVSCGDLPYRDGWRAGSWSGFSSDFSDPAPWYFRTVQSWSRLFVDNGLCLLEIKEPLHPETSRPASIIFTAEPICNRNF